MAYSMTYKFAMAAGMDAANRSARANGREAWNDDDWAIACDTFSRLIGDPDRHYAEQTSAEE